MIYPRVVLPSTDTGLRITQVFSLTHRAVTLLHVSVTGTLIAGGGAEYYVFEYSNSRNQACAPPCNV